MLQQYTHKHGFSLIELLVVTTIIGISIGVSVPFYYQYTQKTEAVIGLKALDGLKNDISICFSKRSSLKKCNGVNGEDKPYFLEVYSKTKGIKHIIIWRGQISATLTAKTISTGKNLEINYTPKIQETSINWILKCSDFGEEAQLIDTCDKKL